MNSKKNMRKKKKKEKAMAKVFLTIDPKTGQEKWEVEGIGGVACEDITRAIQQTSEVVEKQYTHEYQLPEYLPEYLSEGE